MGHVLRARRDLPAVRPAQRRGQARLDRGGGRAPGLTHLLRAALVGQAGRHRGGGEGRRCTGSRWSPGGPSTTAGSTHPCAASCSSGGRWSRGSGPPGTGSGTRTPPPSRRPRRSRSAAGDAGWSSTTRACSRSTTPASRPTSPPCGTSTPGGRRRRGRRRTCSTLTPADIHVAGEDLPDEGDFPLRWSAGPEVTLSLSYAFEPGAAADGVTVDVPLAVLPDLDPAEVPGAAPGLRGDLVTALLRSPAKAIRRQLGPAPNLVPAVLDAPELDRAADPGGRGRRGHPTHGGPGASRGLGPGPRPDAPAAALPGGRRVGEGPG